MKLSETITARDWLVEQGLAKAGRGKFSKVAHEALKSAMAEGMTFSDYGKSDEESYETAPMVHPEGTARFKVGGSKVSMKNACNLCGYSLYWCGCETPVVFGKEVVISPMNQS